MIKMDPYELAKLRTNLLTIAQAQAEPGDDIISAAKRLEAYVLEDVKAEGTDNG